MKASPITLALDELRAAGAWAADCAERVMPLFMSRRPADLRPRGAIEGIREFARGGKRAARLRSLAMAALAAAREVDDPAAKAAARATCQAAAVAYTHPLASVDQGRHILSPAVYAAMAMEHVKGPDAGAAELRWAIQHAPPVVREVLRRFPAQSPGRTRLAVLYHQLDAALRMSE